MRSRKIRFRAVNYAKRRVRMQPLSPSLPLSYGTTTVLLSARNAVADGWANGYRAARREMRHK